MVDLIEKAITEMLANSQDKVDLKTMPAAFFDYFEVTESELAA